MKKRKHNDTLWQRLKDYGLMNTVYVLGLLLFATVVSALIFYYLYTTGDHGFWFELMLAVATSLLASMFCMVSELIVKYKECENDKLVKGLHEFGISDLHFDKKALLKELISKCQKDCWISGYRLILTKGLSTDLTELIIERREIRILVCPPWTDAYKSVYGTKDQSIDNYYWILKAILNGAEGDIAMADKLCRVRFTNKPLFNDTYKVDDYLVTGSYMHNRDAEHGRITASDFFCFDLQKKTQLYRRIYEEYETLWEEAAGELDWAKFDAAYKQMKQEDLREAERIELLQNAFVQLTIDN